MSQTDSSSISDKLVSSNRGCRDMEVFTIILYDIMIECTWAKHLHPPGCLLLRGSLNIGDAAGGVDRDWVGMAGQLFCISDVCAVVHVYDALRHRVHLVKDSISLTCRSFVKCIKIQVAHVWKSIQSSMDTADTEFFKEFQQHGKAC